MHFPYLIKNENNYNDYLRTIKHAQEVFEHAMTPILDKYFLQLETYQQKLLNQELDINYLNPMIYTQKEEYFLYMLLIEYSNRFMKEIFYETSKKIIVLPRCITGPNFDLFTLRRTKIGWHEIIDCNDRENDAWKLVCIGRRYDIDIFITMGRRFKEPSFLRVFHNLNKKYGYGNFGLIAVACIPELALGRTYIMEMGIPTQAIPLFYSGCAKWHGSENAITTKFPLTTVLEIMGINDQSCIKL